MRRLLELLTTIGVPFAALNVLLEQLGLPIPAAPTLVVAGALAAEGRISWVLLVSAALAATLLADGLWFAIGRRYGGAALRLVCRISLSPDSCVRRTESLFTRLGPRAFLIVKFVPGLSAVSVPLAGASRMPLGTFLVYDAAGSLLWSGSAILAGALFHRQVDDILAALESLSSGTLTLLLASLALYLLWRLWERWRFARAFSMTRIPVVELAARLAAEHPPTVFDVRSEAARLRDGREIPGARRLRLESLDDDVAGMPAGIELVLYCT